MRIVGVGGSGCDDRDGGDSRFSSLSAAVPIHPEFGGKVIYDMYFGFDV